MVVINIRDLGPQNLCYAPHRAVHCMHKCTHSGWCDLIAHGCTQLSIVRWTVCMKYHTMRCIACTIEDPHPLQNVFQSFTNILRRAHLYIIPSDNASNHMTFGGPFSCKCKAEKTSIWTYILSPNLPDFHNRDQRSVWLAA